MKKNFNSLGLMSGTSGDGVDASIICSDGKNKLSLITDDYFQYDNNIYKEIHSLRDKLYNKEDLIKFKYEIDNLEKEITLFHASVVKKILSKNNLDISFIGFHGHTIYHNSSEKISKQIGNAKLLSQLTKKTVINNFRENDIKNGGQGAPLTPIFHKLIVVQNKINLPICILNIGGVANATLIVGLTDLQIKSQDLGPGNCMIDEWIRKKSNLRYDKNGENAKAGVVSEILVSQALENHSYKFDKKSYSFDVKDFEINFARGLDFRDGAATITNFTSKLLASKLSEFLKKITTKKIKVLLCGGGRKNLTLVETIKKYCSKNININLIDEFSIDGDYIESQAFAYLAIRTFLKLPISFPETTGCNKPLSGGNITKNF